MIKRKIEVDRAAVSVKIDKRLHKVLHLASKYGEDRIGKLLTENVEDFARNELRTNSEFVEFIVDQAPDMEEFIDEVRGRKKARTA